MARKRQVLAKSMVARIPPSLVRCEVLYAQRGKSPAGFEFAQHAHPFWQIEVVIAGACRCITSEDEIRLRPGDGLLIPAGVSHGFYYDRASRHVSLKVRVAGVMSLTDIISLNDLPAWNSLRDALVMLIDHDRPDRARQHATSHLVEALIALGIAPRAERAEPPSFVEQVRRLIEQGENRRWTVASIARALELSPGHASSVFRAQSAMTLKSFLDQARQEAAASLLADTDHNISEIADLLEFPDVFAFSRFVRRVTGVSPRKLRERLRKEH